MTQKTTWIFFRWIKSLIFLYKHICLFSLSWLPVKEPMRHCSLKINTCLKQFSEINFITEQPEMFSSDITNDKIKQQKNIIVLISVHLIIELVSYCCITSHPKRKWWVCMKRSCSELCVFTLCAQGSSMTCVVMVLFSLEPI